MPASSKPDPKQTVDKIKVRKLMRFWTFGTFIISAAAVTTYAGMVTGFLIFREPLYWVIIGGSAAASVVILLVHEWYLNSQS